MAEFSRDIGSERRISLPVNSSSPEGYKYLGETPKHTVHPNSVTCPEMFRHHAPKGSYNGSELWVDGLLCAYEYIPAPKTKVEVGGQFGQESGAMKGNFVAEITLKDPKETQEFPRCENIKRHHKPDASNRVKGHRADLHIEDENEESKLGDPAPTGFDQNAAMRSLRNQWIPIGWKRIAELVQYVQGDSFCGEGFDANASDDDSVAVADQAAPYWQLPSGPIWWCHVNAGHPHILSWLAHAQWLHPAISSALQDEGRLISERMRHLFYEVPVRVAGGLLFELIGQSVGDRNEDDVPIVLRSWTSLNFLITAMHVKGEVPSGLNVIGISEVQDIVWAGGPSVPRTAHEVVALLADRLSRWDDRLYRKYCFGEADEVELKFVSRRGHEDLAIMSIILNQEIRRLSTQVIRVKWALHAREEILYELMVHLRGKHTQALLNKISKSTRIMLGEQEAVRGRLFTVQDVMQSTVRAALQDKSVRIQHNLAVIGGVGLFLSTIAGLFGINLDGIPGSENSPYAFGIFSLTFFILGVIAIGLGILYLGFKKPPTEKQLASRKLELQHLVKQFQISAEAHEKLKVGNSWHGSQDRAHEEGRDTGDYILFK